MVSSVTVPELPGWYMVLKDFIALEAALVALGGAFFAYRAAMAKVNHDRLAAIEERKNHTTCIELQIERSAYIMARTCRYLLKSESEQAAIEDWNVMIRARFEANAQAAEKSVDALLALLPKSAPDSMEGLTTKLKNLGHWAFAMRSLAGNAAQIDAASAEGRNKLGFLVDGTWRMFNALKKLASDPPDLNFQVRLAYPFLQEYRDGAGGALGSATAHPVAPFDGANGAPAPSTESAAAGTPGAR